MQFLKKFKKQIGNSLIYILSTIGIRAVPFFLLPVFTTYLSKKDYGMLGLIAAITSIISIYVGLRPSLYIIVKGPQIKREDLSVYIFNIFVLALVVFVFVIVVLLFIRKYFFSQIDWYIFIVLGMIALFSVIHEVVEAIFQIERKAILYGIFQFGKTIVFVSFALFFIIELKMNWEGKFFADLISIFLFAFIGFLYLKRFNYISPSFQFEKQKELFSYLFPLTFHVLGLAMMASIDRLFLANMLGMEATGLYTVAYTIGALLGIVHDALLKVWSPEFYSRIKNADLRTRIKILKFNYLYIVASFVLFCIFIVVAPYVFKLMINSKFQEGYAIVPIIALGLTFEGLRKLFIGYLYNLNKNKLIALTTIAGGGINVILNYFMIPIYGIKGAAYATLISYIIVFCFTIISVNRIEIMPWGLKNDSTN